jgi:hypothetical protein
LRGLLREPLALREWVVQLRVAAAQRVRVPAVAPPGASPIASHTLTRCTAPAC